MSDLNSHQKEVTNTEASQIVLRWGRRTGKDYLIEHIAGKNDVLIYPTMPMAKVLNPGMTSTGKLKNGSICVSNPYSLVGLNKIERLFVIEPALHDNLYEVLYTIRRIRPKKLYLVGTPIHSDKILSSAFLFSALTREAAAQKSDDLFFSRVGVSDVKHIELDMEQFRIDMGDTAWLELDAMFYPEEEK